MNANRKSRALHNFHKARSHARWESFWEVTFMVALLVAWLGTVYAYQLSTHP